MDGVVKAQKEDSHRLDVVDMASRQHGPNSYPRDEGAGSGGVGQHRAVGGQPPPSEATRRGKNRSRPRFGGRTTFPINGRRLRRQDGKRGLSQCDVYVAKAESDFW